MAVFVAIKGVLPSNKPKKTDGGKTIEDGEVSYSVITTMGDGVQRTIKVLKPKIDDISLLYEVKEAEEQATVMAVLKHLAELDPKFDDISQSLRGKTKYKANVTLRIGAKNRVLIQAGPTTKAQTAFMRLELNPNKLGPKGVASLKDGISSLFTGKEIFEQLTQEARVSRVDVACDLVNVGIDELILRSAKPGKSHAFHGQTGKLETLYLGIGPAGKASKLKAYDKGQQLVDIGEKAEFGTMAQSRIEVTVQMTKFGLPKLATLKNPLSAIEVLCPSPPAGVGATQLWTFFLDSCRFRGIDAAVALLPENLREPWAAAVSAGEHKLWRPKVIWQAWPEVVANSGLLGHTVE